MLLSIVIPVYQLEKYLIKTLDSLINQMQDNIEIILVNDGSTDNSESLIRQYISMHKGFHITLHTTENAGVGAARNFGTDKAHGEYILYLDGDDILCKGSLEAIIKSIKEDKADIIFWPFDVVEESGECIISYPYPPRETLLQSGASALRDLLVNKSMYLVIGSAAYRKLMLTEKALAFSVGCVAGEDMEFTIKALSISAIIKYCHVARLQYIQREDSTVHVYNIRRFDSIEALKRTSEYLSNSQNNSMYELAKIVANNEILINYIGTYRLCLEQMMKEKRVSSKFARKCLDKDIMRNYPGLLVEIQNLLRHHKRFLPINRIAIFYLSPIIYMYFAKIKRTIQLLNKKVP